VPDPSLQRCARWWMNRPTGHSWLALLRRGGSGFSEVPQPRRNSRSMRREGRPAPWWVTGQRGPRRSLAQADGFVRRCRWLRCRARASEGELKGSTSSSKADVQERLEAYSRLAEQTAPRASSGAGAALGHRGENHRTDVGSLAAASGAVIVGFKHLPGLRGPRRRPMPTGRRARLEVILQAAEDIQSAMEGLTRARDGGETPG